MRWRREKTLPCRRLGHSRPGGIAARVPVTRIGTIDRLWAAASTAAPRRTRPGPPSRVRVPSGNSSRFQPWSSSLSRCPLPFLPIPPPRRSIGTVLKTSDTAAATRRFL